MSNLLVQKLKSVKRELTALKTAHRRGLGSLKIFKYRLKISGYTDAVYKLAVTIKFASGSARYPFISFAQQCDPDTYLTNADLISMDFTNGGTAVVLNFDWFALTSIDPYSICFYSSSPIEEVTYVFTREA